MSEPRTAIPPKRILHIHSGNDIYGASRMLLRWLKNMDRRWFDPLVILPSDGPLKKLIEAEGIEVILHPRLSFISRFGFRSWKIIPFCLNYPVSVFYLWRVIRQKRVALVYTNTGVIISPALAAWLAGVPHLWHIRESFQEFRRVWPIYSRFIMWFSSRVISVSNAIAGQFGSRSNVAVVHDGFSSEEFQVPKEKLRTEFRSRYELTGHFVVGCVGRIKWVRKGQEFLVQATSVLKQRGCSVKALIVGTPFPGNEDHLKRLQNLIKELDVGEQVFFTGELSDTRPAYAAMDALVLTSAQPEPFGNVVVEAMGMGLPVIATNMGGSLDQVVDGVTGLLVAPGDPVALADAIEKLMHDPELRTRMGAAAANRVREHFSITKMVCKIEAIIDEALRRERI
jgi:glycosyltransferase involved in cell wall biosynthesis